MEFYYNLMRKLMDFFGTVIVGIFSIYTTWERRHLINIAPLQNLVSKNVNQKAIHTKTCTTLLSYLLWKL